MLIVSQSKGSIVNADMLLGFSTSYRKDPYDKLKKHYMVRGHYTLNDKEDRLLLGEYATAERAQEILLEIADAYRSGNSSLGSRPVVKNVVYMMPEE